MNLDITELKELTPAALPESLLDRLDAAMSDAGAGVVVGEEKIIFTTTDDQLLTLEKSLQKLVPYGVPEDMVSRLDEAMSRWHEKVPVEEKVVEIYPEPEPALARNFSSWLGLRSVAAVGLLGAGVAFMMGESDPAPIAKAQRIPVRTIENTTPATFTSNNARASVVAANDHGVIWTKAGRPVRCTEVHVTNSLQFVNERGERLILEHPMREVRFTSVKFD